jgi:hypothetical protein
MTRTIKAIEIPGSFSMAGKGYFRIQFLFHGHPPEFFNVEESQWVKICQLAHSKSAGISWNELKNEIYYAVVMGTAEFPTHA